MTARKWRFEISNLKFICVHLCSSVVLFLVCSGCQQVSNVGAFGQNLMNFFSGNTPLNAAKQMEDRYFPDERREGIVRLANQSFGLREPYVDRYRQIAQLDSDWLVRATAIRSLNRARDASATPIFIKALADQNEVVRVEAAKALANIPDPNAAAPLLRLIADPNESRDVRIWSAHALRHYRNLQVARTLATQLGGREFGLAWQAHKSLVSITGRDLAYNEAAWLDYFTGPERPFG